MKKYLLLLILILPLPGSAQRKEYFKGRIGINSLIRMWIGITGDSIEGRYFYTGRGEEIVIRGRLTNGEYKLSEFDEGNNVKGALRFQKKSAAGIYTGSWQAGHSLRKQMKLVLTLIPESKQKIDPSKPIVFKPETASQQDDWCNVTVSYPHISNVSDNYSFALFNASSKADAEDNVKNFGCDEPDDDQKEGMQPAYLAVNYSVEQAYPPLLNFSFAEDAYLGGGHGGAESLYARTFSTSKCRWIHIRDFFKSAAPFAQRLSALCREKLKDTVFRKCWANADNGKDSALRKRYAESFAISWLDKNVGLKENNFEGFILSKKGLRFLFEEHFEAFVSYNELDDMLDKEGDLQYLLSH